MDDGQEEAPSELNPVNMARFLELAKDKLTVRYVGKGNHAHDVGAIQANRPVPRHVYACYFELSVLNPGARGWAPAPADAPGDTARRARAHAARGCARAPARGRRGRAGALQSALRNAHSS